MRVLRVSIEMETGGRDWTGGKRGCSERDGRGGEIEACYLPYNPCSGPAAHAFIFANPMLNWNRQNQQVEA